MKKPIEIHLKCDPDISPETLKALCNILKAAHEQLSRQIESKSSSDEDLYKVMNCISVWPMKRKDLQKFTKLPSRKLTAVLYQAENTNNYFVYGKNGYEMTEKGREKYKWLSGETGDDK